MLTHLASLAKCTRVGSSWLGLGTHYAFPQQKSSHFPSISGKLSPLKRPATPPPRPSYSPKSLGLTSEWLCRRMTHLPRVCLGSKMILTSDSAERSLPSTPLVFVISFGNWPHVSGYMLKISTTTFPALFLDVKSFNAQQTTQQSRTLPLNRKGFLLAEHSRGFTQRLQPALNPCLCPLLPSKF